MPPPFKKITRDQFASVLTQFPFTRRITGVHMHHTWMPDRAQYRGHDSIVGMWEYHTKRNGWSDIAQHITIAPDGTIWLGIGKWLLRLENRFRLPVRLAVDAGDGIVLAKIVEARCAFRAGPFRAPFRLHHVPPSILVQSMLKCAVRGIPATKRGAPCHSYGALSKAGSLFLALSQTGYRWPTTPTCRSP